MTKFYAGMLVGFFLATTIMFGIVQMYVAPYEGTIRTAQPYAQDMYAMTHSDYYSSTENIAAKVREYAAKVAEIPVIGEMVQAGQVEQYANDAVALFANARESSEVVVLLIGWALLLLGMTMPALLFSIAMVILGVWMYKTDCGACCMGEAKPEAKAPATKARKRKR